MYWKTITVRLRPPYISLDCAAPQHQTLQERLPAWNRRCMVEFRELNMTCQWMHSACEKAEELSRPHDNTNKASWQKAAPSPSKLTLRNGGFGTPSNTRLLGPAWLHNPNDISIGSAVFAGWRSWQTDRQRDHARSVTAGRIYGHQETVLPGDCMGFTAHS